MKKKLKREGIKLKYNNKTNPKNFPYLLTSYNKYHNMPSININNKTYHNKTHNKLRINTNTNSNTNNTFTLYDPDEEYVTKLNFFNIDSQRDYIKKVTLYNLNTKPQFPTIIKKDTDNAESFNEKKRILNELKSKKTMFDKKNNSESSKQTYVNRYENTFKENQLEKERKEIEKKMFKLKEMIKSLSNELSITIKELDNLQLDVEIVQNYRNYNLFTITHKNSNQLDNINLPPKKIRRSISKEKDSSIEKEKSKEKAMKERERDKNNIIFWSKNLGK